MAKQLRLITYIIQIDNLSELNAKVEKALGLPLRNQDIFNFDIKDNMGLTVNLTVWSNNYNVDNAV